MKKDSLRKTYITNTLTFLFCSEVGVRQMKQERHKYLLLDHPSRISNKQHTLCNIIKHHSFTIWARSNHLILYTLKKHFVLLLLDYLALSVPLSENILKDAFECLYLFCLFTHVLHLVQNLMSVVT